MPSLRWYATDSFQCSGSFSPGSNLLGNLRVARVNYSKKDSNSQPTKAESRYARRAPNLVPSSGGGGATLSLGSTFYPASMFVSGAEPPPPLEGPDLYATTGGAASSSSVPPYSSPVFPGELQRAHQGRQHCHLRALAAKPRKQVGVAPNSVPDRRQTDRHTMPNF